MFEWLKQRNKTKYIDITKIKDVQDLLNILLDTGILPKTIEVAPRLEQKYKHLLKEYK